MIHPLAKVKDSNNRSIGFMVYNSEKGKSEFMTFKDLRANRHSMVGLLNTPKSIVLNQYYKNIGTLSDSKEQIVPSYTCVKRIFGESDTKYLVVSSTGVEKIINIDELKQLIDQGNAVAGVLMFNAKLKFCSSIEVAFEEKAKNISNLDNTVAKSQ